MYDILIKNGRYPDFDTKEFVNGNVAISDGKIVAVGCVDGEAKTVIDASDRVVSPGFIDIHMHEEQFLEDGEKYIIAELMMLMGVTTAVGGNCGVNRQDVDVFKGIIEKLGGAPINYAVLAGYNSERNKLKIGRHEPATDEQIDQLIAKLRSEVEAGAYGISFGVEYDPGMPYEEVMKVLKGMPQEDLFVSMHYRDDSTGAIPSIHEMISFAKESGKKFQISHLSSCSCMGQMKEAMPLINQAVAENPRLDYDTYPYNAFSTEIGTAVFEDGCFEQWNKGPENLFMTCGKYKNQFCTKETFEEIRRDDPSVRIVAFVMNEEEIAEAIANPSCGMIGSDGGVNRNSGHPRASGTFPRVLGKYVREDKVISLIDALYKMTLAPAKRLDMDQKGQIKVGMDADITIFDPETIKEGSTFENIFIKPVGIDAVIVDGQVAVDHNEIVNAKAGKFIPGPYTK
ncbi:MAG: amidohydrolase family protein [Firmicutes bacterium]|nr:amidohydrolase family protein [Bacillota bacterium]